ncbi:MAG: potassium channel protein, partial [Planctomycetales bacterium]|nr:potassium channel protein [Planctomycetales bacterium]
MPLLIRIRRGLTLLAALCAVSVVGYKLLTGKSWLESIYFFVITASTVGYGEQSSVSPSVQLFTILMILCSAVVVAYTLGLIIQSLVEGQINLALGVLRMTREIEGLSNHTIICGYGRIGQTLAEDLIRRDVPFVIVDLNPDIIREANEHGCLAVTGDATDEDTLRQAGIQRAKTLVVALQGDAENVFLTLTARNLAPDLRIIARGEQPATEKKLRQAGADQVVLPAVIGARRMSALVTRPYTAEMLEHFANHERIDAGLEELTIPADCTLVGKSVRALAARQRHNLLVIGIRKADGAMLFNPDPDKPFE